VAKLAPVVFGDANEADVLAQGGQDRFANPPDGEGDELVTPFGVEAPGGLEQAEIALVEKILERQSQVAVLAGDLGDESEVGLDQVVEGLPVPFAGTAGQADLFLATERSFGANLREIPRQSRAILISRRMHSITSLRRNLRRHHSRPSSRQGYDSGVKLS